MKTRIVARVLSLAAVALLLSSSAISQGRVLTPELVLSVRSTVDAQLSPDGANVVFQVSRSRRDDEKPGAAIHELWMTSTRGGEPYRFSHNQRNDRSPRWSPDGKSIAYLSDRGDPGGAQLFVIPLSGGEAVRLTSAENAVTQFQWSPDGSKIAYLSADPKTKEELANERAGKDWIVFDENYKHTRLYVIDVRTKEAKLVTQSDLTVYHFDWSSDGKQFLLAAAATPLVDDSYMKLKLMTVSSEGGAPVVVINTEGKLNSPRWSPDGKWIAWLGATAFNDSYAGSVFIVPVGGGTPENLVKGEELSATWLDWLPGKPNTLVFSTIERQANAIYSVTLPARKRVPLCSQPLIYASNPSFSKDGKSFTISANSPAHPNEVFLGESGNNKPLTRLTRLNPQLADLQLGEQEVIKWKSIDGMEIEGVIVKPVGFRRGIRYPTVMQVHGGPEAADLNGWTGTSSRWGQLLAARGFVTFYPNYRGSIGRGTAFATADHRDLMGKEFQDMLAGIDYLVREGITDAEHVGLGGGSYGGYTAAWGATHGSARFKAAVAWMGISDWYSMTGTSDIFLENSAVHWDAIMYDNYELYWERSPIAHIKKSKTPTLIIHGAADPRVPPGQSMELYTAMKWKGVPVQFVMYPREGHGVQETEHQRDFMNRVLGWFEKYLKNGDGGR